jgi:hypothetical protein
LELWLRSIKVSGKNWALASEELGLFLPFMCRSL